MCADGRIGAAICEPPAGRPEQVERVEVAQLESGVPYDPVDASPRVATLVAVPPVERAEESWVGGDEQAEPAPGAQGPRHRGDRAVLVLDVLQDVLAEHEVRLDLELGEPGRAGDRLLHQQYAGVLAEPGAEHARTRRIGLHQHESINPVAQDPLAERADAGTDLYHGPVG